MKNIIITTLILICSTLLFGEEERIKEATLSQKVIEDFLQLDSIPSSITSYEKEDLTSISFISTEAPFKCFSSIKRYDKRTYISITHNKSQNKTTIDAKILEPKKLPQECLTGFLRKYSELNTLEKVTIKHNLRENNPGISPSFSIVFVEEPKESVLNSFNLILNQKTTLDSIIIKLFSSILILLVLGLSWGSLKKGVINE